MSTEIGLDTAKATSGLKELKSAVQDSTNEWKQMESQLKKTGDDIGASEAKYKGLSQSVEKQEDVLAKLRKEQSEVNRSTEAGEQTYQKYAGQITTAERQLASMTKQQADAKRAYELQESGIQGLNKEIQNSIKETDAYVERLKAEGKEEEALKVQKEGLSKTLGKQEELYKAQTKQLEKMTKSGDASADSISKQKIALDKTGTSIAKGKKELQDLDTTQSKVGKNEGATEASGKFNKLTGAVDKTKMGMVKTTAAAATAMAGVTKLVDQIYDQQSQVNTLQAKTTGSYQQSKEAIAEINKLYAEGYGESVEDLTETYTKLKQMNPKADLKDLSEQTRLVSQYAKASGADTEEVMRGAQNATKAWNISYEEYFDNMFTLQKVGGDVSGNLSDEMSEYTQIMGQMGLTAKDSFSAVANGIESGAYNSDKLLDFVKEFNNSLNDGRMEEKVENFSKKSQEMFKQYQKGNVTGGEMFKQITNEMANMTDKQKEATLASDTWSALGEDNALAVIESLGKSNKAFDDVKGTAKETGDLLKESNPFELMKRGAQASISSVSLNATETKKFKEALEPLQKAMKQLIESVIKNMPMIVKTLTPVIDLLAKNLPIIIGFMSVMMGMKFAKSVVGGLNSIKGATNGVIDVAKKAKGLSKNFDWKSKLDTSGFNKGINGVKSTASKAKSAIANSVKWSANLVKSGFEKSISSIKSVASGVKSIVEKSLKFTASVAKSGFDKGVGAVKKTAEVSGKAITKSLKFTAKVATKGANLAMKGLVKTAKATGKGINLAFNFLKANPLFLLVSVITAVIVAFVELYKHNKKFKKFVDGLVKGAMDFFKGITKWFGDTWKALEKSFKAFSKWFSKNWDGFISFIGKVWSNGWKAVQNVFDKYVGIYKKILKTFIDFFTGNWKNLGKDIKGIWDAMWKFVESIFGGKSNGIKKGIEGFGRAIWGTFETIKTNVTKFWSNMWDGLTNFARTGINAVIGVVNTGIGGINGVIHTFGGSANAISKIPKFANGTKEGGAPKGLALVNDAPGENYQEAIIDNSGQVSVLEGRNRLVNFSGGETVIPAHALPKFAGGTFGWLESAVGWVTDKWSALTDMIAHPIKALGGIMTKAVSGISGSSLVTNMAPALANGFVQGIASPITGLFKSLKKKHDDEGAKAPAGTGVERWRAQATKALEMNGLSTSRYMVDKVLRQIATESGGNERAVQGDIGDINNITGDLAKGLMQTISSTFNAFAHPGHGNIFNGYDNMLAGLNYAKNRYGAGLDFLGNGHGYAQGGIVSQHGLYEVAEQNMPEIIIPLDPNKRTRANDLLAQANQRINGTQQAKGQNSVVNEGDNYTIEINVNADVTPNSVQKIAQAVEEVITRKQNSKTRVFG